MSAGRRSRRSRPCCATTTPSTTATRRAAFHGMVRLCCMESSIAARAATRWSCNTRAAHAISATTFANSTARPYASVFPLAQSMRRAQAQQVERLRYRAALAERQYDQVDPDNRLVAAELERRWEEALRDVRQAEAALATARAEVGEVPVTVDDALRAAFTDAGRRLPELWHGSILTRARKKALLRCLIDKVVIHRSAPDTI